MYADSRGSLGVVCMRFEKCMGTPVGRLYEVWEVALRKNLKVTLLTMMGEIW